MSRIGRNWRSLIAGLTLAAVSVFAIGRAASSRILAADATVVAAVESSPPRQSLRSLVTPQSRKSIDSGLEWIKQAVRRDGTIGTDAYQPPDLACTAIVGLTLMAEGSTPVSGRYAPESQRILYGVYDLVERRLSTPYRPENSSLVQRKIGANADIFLATIYLAQVFGEAPGEEEQIQKLLEKLIDRICRTQGEDGTWGTDSWAPVLGTVLGWESLRTASSAGFRVNASAELAGQALIKSLREHNQRDAQSWMHSFYKDSSSLRVLYSLHFRDDPLFKESVARLVTIARTDKRPFQLAGGEEFLAFHLVTECLIKESRPDWNSWYPNVRDNLVRQQNRDGSWTGHHCITDRTFCTAAALLTLLAPNQSLPISDL